MLTKVLSPPEGTHDSAIVAANGCLRMMDRPKRCKGYANCCRCHRCMEREARRIPRPAVATCGCDRPLYDTAGAACFKCGKARPARQAA